MNDETAIGTITALDDGDYAIMTDKGLVPMTGTIGISDPSNWGGSNITMASNIIGNGGTSTQTIRITQTVDEVMDEHSLNRFAIDHKVSAQELLKLQEVAPDYASEIKENIAKNLARDIAKKVMFKKKHDKDADVHHFIGRVWVFTDEELKALLNEVM